jgi:pimeloyl-ACP methyl ester carboxylesterase
MSEPRTRVEPLNGVELALQTFGNPGHSTILLISGASTSMDMWPPALCERIAAAGRYVVRNDLRDTGQSNSYGAGGATYTQADLVADAIAILDHLQVRQAHLVGMSMGGVLAQLLAATHSVRVATLTLISTTPALPGMTERHLPDMPVADQEAFAAVLPPDWSNPTSIVDYLVEQERLCAARSMPFDFEHVRAIWQTAVARTRDPQAMENHFRLSVTAPGQTRITDVAAPTLIVHGDEDPVFPLAHAQALAEEIPGAQLRVIRALGHEVPPRIWDELVDAIVRHTQPVERS